MFTLFFTVFYLVCWWIVRETPLYIGGIWIYVIIGLSADIMIYANRPWQFRQRVIQRPRPHLQQN